MSTRAAPVYRVVRLEGGYRDRQLEANRLGCVGYVEHHLNALEYDKPGSQDNPTLCVVTKNASAKSIEWAGAYTKIVSGAFDVPNQGALRRGPEGRGYWNLAYTRMPAILVEPLFISDMKYAEIAISLGGQVRMAQCLMESIEQAFPRGGLFGISCGHKGVRADDRGAPARMGNMIVGWESEISDKVLSIVEQRWGA